MTAVCASFSLFLAKEILTQVVFFFLDRSSNKYGTLVPKLIWFSVRKNCSTDREKLLKYETEGKESAKFLRSLEQFILAVKGQNNFC